MKSTFFFFAKRKKIFIYYEIFTTRRSIQGELWIEDMSNGYLMLPRRTAVVYVKISYVDDIRTLQNSSERLVS